eukprot:12178545-Alexandrium_andersonii.AAC.1
MSASLVGSEMCIRDRSDGTRACLFQAGAVCVLRCGGRRKTGVARRRAPVSYTHLTLPTICSV